MAQETPMETVAPDLSQIPAEPGIDGYGESMTEPANDVFIQELQNILDQEGYDLQIVERTEPETEVSTLSLEEEFAAQPELAEVRAASDPELSRAQSPLMPEEKAYKLSLDGVEYYAWFPAGAELVVTDEGYIYNEGASNITGAISNSLNGLSLGSYNDFVTIAPLLTTGSNSNAYRYGSRVYITDYYVNNGTLYNSVSYVTEAKALDTPGAGYGFSRYQLLTIGFLLILVFILLIRGRKSI